MISDELDMPSEERNRVYSASELVDLALDGHYCLRDRINNAIWHVYEIAGAAGRKRMHALPALRAYASEPEIDVWEAELLALERQVESEHAESRSADDDLSQPGLFDR